MNFIIALAFAVFVFVIACEAKYGPKPAPPKRVTIPDVWATIASAQKTVDDSYRLIYGRAGRE